jgi:hypothetical protein
VCTGIAHNETGELSAGYKRRLDDDVATTDVRVPRTYTCGQYPDQDLARAGFGDR